MAGMRLRQSEVPQALSSAAIKALGTSDGQMVFGHSREESKRSMWALRMSLWPDIASAMDTRSSEGNFTVARVLYGQIDLCSSLKLVAKYQPFPQQHANWVLLNQRAIGE